MTIQALRAAMLTVAGTVAFALPAAAFATTADSSSDGGSGGQATSANQAGQANDKQSLTSSDIIVTASPLAESAPVASLTTTQPQSAINRAFIDNVTTPISDFTALAAIAPSVTLGGTSNGVGLQESKLTIRGFQDGDYNMTYDSIPFSDTNNPTHHSLSFFPSNTIETMVIDRGPGNASQLGQATFGGNVNLYSRGVSDKAGGQIEGAAGSFGTWLARAEYQTGSIDSLGGARFVVTGNIQESDGALTASGTLGKNIFAKGVMPIGSANTLTVLATYNQIRYYQSDKGTGWCGSADGSPTASLTGDNCNPASPIAIYGKNFGLVGGDTAPAVTDPYATSWYKYNRTDKKTDFEIIRLQSDLGNGFSMDNRLYMYGYTNQTLSGTDDQGQNSGKVITAVTAINPTTGKLTTTSGPGVPGYHKLNKYRTWGYIGQVNYEFSLGQIRLGGWYEKSNSDRFTHDVNLVTDTPDYREKVVTALPYTLTAQPDFSSSYDQGSDWNQYQLFAEFEFRPTSALSITPGIKYVHFTRKIEAAVNQTSRAPIYTQATWTQTLPFLTANYQVANNWSFYFQFAKGFYVPDLSAFYSSSANLQQSLADLKPQTSENFQLGTVYHGNKFSVDADVYTIKVNNLIGTCNTAGCDTSLEVNVGSVRYRGLEGQLNFLAMPGLTLFVNGSLNDALNEDTGGQLSKTPYGTAGGGAIYSRNGLNISYIHKLTGAQYATEYNGDPSRRLYRIAPYSVGDFAISKDIGTHLRLGVNVNNVWDSRVISAIKSSSKGAPTDSNGFQSAYGQYDQLQFLPPRQVMVDLRVKF